MRFERWLYVLPLRLRSLFRGASVDRELDEELQYHLERQIQLNIERGMTADDARHAARLAMGGLEQHKEDCRDRRKVSVVDHAIRDVRYGLRLLGRAPVFTTVAILSLALGIGANAAIFHLIDTVRLRSLPVANPEQLAEVRADGVQAFGVSDGINSQVTYPLWEQIRAHQSAFASMFAWSDTTFLVGRGADSSRARGLWVSGDSSACLASRPNGDACSRVKTIAAAAARERSSSVTRTGRVISAVETPRSAARSRSWIVLSRSSA